MIENNGVSYPNHSQSWGIAGIILLSTIVFSPVSIVLNNAGVKDISFFAYYLLAMGVSFWIAHQLRKKKTNVSEFEFDLSSLKVMMLVFVAAIGTQVGIVSPLVSLIPIPEFMKRIFLELAQNRGIFSFITLVLAAPVLEELIFRGIMLDGLLKKYSPVKAILISSFLFGIIHLNPWQFIAAFMIGIFSGWVYYRTRKLTLCILIHLANNLFAFGTWYFTDAEAMINRPLSEFYGGYINFIMIVVGAITAVAICLYFLWYEFKITSPVLSGHEPSEGT